MNSSSRGSSWFGPIHSGELVWSYFARILDLIPGDLSFHELSVFLGGRPLTYRKLFPARLGDLARTFKFVGAPTANDLVARNTLFPLAKLQVTRGEADRLSESLMAAAHPVGVPRSLQLPGSFLLRFCPACGMDYWRLIHQVPELEICAEHGSALVATTVSALTREPVMLSRYDGPLAPVVVEGKALQELLADTYRDILDVDGVPSRDGVAAAVRQLIGAKKQLNSVAKEFRDRWGSQVDLICDVEKQSNHPAWLAMFLEVTRTPLHEFLSEARRLEALVPPPITRQAAVTLPPLALRVQELVPQAQRALSAKQERITRWALACELNAHLGVYFARNHSFREPIKSILDRFVETETEHAERVCGLIRSRRAELGQCVGIGEFVKRAGVTSWFRMKHGPLLRELYEELHV